MRTRTQGGERLFRLPGREGVEVRPDVSKPVVTSSDQGLSPQGACEPGSREAYKLVVFPNDPIYKYYQKGEIKPRYWNPGDIFSEVHLVSLADQEVAPEKVAALAGRGRLFIHAIGRPGNRELLNLPRYRDRVVEVVRRINPQLIRAHNPSLHGWLATQCARRLGIPSVISIHCDYSRWRNFRILGIEYLPRFVRSLGERILFESFSLRWADRILPAYAFPKRYVSAFRKDGIEVIYNKVYGEQYAGRPERGEGRFRILSVGRHIRGKDPRPLIRAIAGLDAELVLIGTGPLTENARELASRLGVVGQVTFIDMVPNEQIHEHYLAADAFAIAITYGGICIPVLEAMAAGLPIVVPRPLWEKEPELVGRDAALVVENSPHGFREAFLELSRDPQLSGELGSRAKERFAAVDGRLMERREAELFLELIRRGPRV